VRPNVINFRDPWDFSEVYTKLRDFARNYAFDPDSEDYIVNITPARMWRKSAGSC
jgi:transcriptional regulatory protein RtcR